MRLSRLALGHVAVVAAGLTVAAALPAGLAAARTGVTAPAGPTIKVVATVRSVNVPKNGTYVQVDPGIYVETFGPALEFYVRRASYAKPLTITQVIQRPGSRPVLRPLPASTLQGWSGLRRFLQVTVRNARGRTVTSSVLPFCPSGFSPQRATPTSPGNSPFPANCYSGNPFQKGAVWGLQRGWGEDPLGGGIGRGGMQLKLGLGRYTMTVQITQMWRRLLYLSRRAPAATVRIHVVRPSQCTQPCQPQRRALRTAGTGALPRLQSAPTMAHPPAAVLPDLIPLPSWGISVQNHPATSQHLATSLLSFGATVWIGGHSRLDVEGFRSGTSPVMPAYQYFWRGGRIVGRVRAGTMGFDNKKGHHHWHFQQFAEYRLLNAGKNLVERSHKVGFCLAPDNAIDLTIPHAQWQLKYTSQVNQCGTPDALWVQEMLPLGWGDTYAQSVAGNSFNITNLPDGTYYIQVIANPEHVLHESNYRNDASLRKVILGGTSGHRTVRVPAYHGIDPEH